jgi:hypothetical protein
MLSRQPPPKIREAKIIRTVEIADRADDWRTEPARRGAGLSATT